MSKQKKNRFRPKIVIGHQDDLWSDVHKNVIKAQYFKSLQPESRITKGKVEKINKIVNEAIKKQKLLNDITNIDSE